jgi:HK97 gp10 family phage protein
MSSFSLKKGDADKIIKGLLNQDAIIKKSLEQKMRTITNMVYVVAHSKRPMITVAQAKAEGRRKIMVTNSKGVSKMVIKRVSNPNAIAGVPVDTGALQASINQEVVWKGEKVVGTITAGEGLNYANAIEFGTSKMPARPFMRPAMNEQRDAIRKLFKQPINKL